MQIFYTFTIIHCLICPSVRFIQILIIGFPLKPVLSCFDYRRSPIRLMVIIKSPDNQLDSLTSLFNLSICLSCSLTLTVNLKKHRFIKSLPQKFLKIICFAFRHFKCNCLFNFPGLLPQLFYAISRGNSHFFKTASIASQAIFRPCSALTVLPASIALVW